MAQIRNYKTWKSATRKLVQKRSLYDEDHDAYARTLIGALVLITTTAVVI